MKIEFLIDGAQPDPYLGVFNGYIQEEINCVTIIELFTVAEYMLSEQELENFIGKTTTIKLSEPINREMKVNRYDGLIYEVRQLNPYIVSKDKFIYKIIIRPAIWKMSICSKARSFLNKSRTEVIDEVLKEYGFKDGMDYEARFGKESDYPKLSQVLQCEISDWTFVSQLLLEAGINYSFHSKKDGSSNEKLRLVDNNAFFPKPISEAIEWKPASNMVAGRHIESFETHVRSIPSSVQATATFGDGKTRNFQSEVSLDKGVGGTFRVFSAEGQNESVAKHSAKIVSDGFEAKRIVYEGKSNHFLIRAGERINIDCSYFAVKKKALITSVNHTFKQGIDHAMAGQQEINYHNEFIGAKDSAEIRPSRYMKTINAECGIQNPMLYMESEVNADEIDTSSMAGRDVNQELSKTVDWLTKSTNTFGIMLGEVVEDAKVSSGQEMTCKVANERFPDGLIAKVSIAWLVPGGGASALPRAGMQVYFVIVQGEGGQNEAVIISYRPSSGVKGQDPSKSVSIKTVVPGSSPNEAVKVDSISPSNRERVGLTGEGGCAEVTLLDGAGSVSIHATADILLVSDAKTSMSSSDHMHMSGAVSEQFASVNRIVGGDQTEKIGSNHSITITGNQTAKVDGNEDKKIGGTRSITVTGAVTDKIDGNETKTVKGPRVVSMKAGHAESITGAASTTIKGAKTLSVSATSSETIKGSKTETIKGSKTETIKGSKSVKVKGDIVQDAKGAFVTGVKKDAGFKVDGNLTFEVKKRVQIKCGSSSIIVEKNGNVTIKGKKLTQKFSGDVKVKGSKVNIN